MADFLFSTGRVVDLVHGPPPHLLDGHTFDRCTLEGPAVLALLDGVTMRGCLFHCDGDLDSMIWPVRKGQVVRGAIGVKDCEFVGCTFDGIGIAMTPKLERMFRQGTTRG